MNIQDLNKKAILSEKAYKLMERGVYSFLVDRRATKDEVAKFVEGHFKVKVQKVNVLPLAQKKKRIGRTRKFAAVGGGKKALVYLVAGQSIAMLQPKTESKTKKTKKEKDVQVTSAEGKET